MDLGTYRYGCSAGRRPRRSILGGADRATRRSISRWIEFWPTTTIRRELLDHVIVLNEAHLRRRLRSYLRYYHGTRTHLALEKDAPEPRAVEPPEHGRVVPLPHVSGLHYRYVRRAA